MNHPCMYLFRHDFNNYNSLFVFFIEIHLFWSIDKLIESNKKDKLIESNKNKVFRIGSVIIPVRA